MDDYISRQAAIRNVCEKECRVLKPCNAECGSIIALRELPFADVQQVVRCKDCKYYCEPWCEHLEINNIVDESFYCGYGARKSGEQYG